MEPLVITNEKNLFDSSRYASIRLNSTFDSFNCSSADILDSFEKSRKQCITSLFEPAPRHNIIHTHLGSCTIMIGPHVYAGSQFYKVRAQTGMGPNHSFDSHTRSQIKDVTQVSTPPTSPISPTNEKFDIIFELQDSHGSKWLFPRDVKLKTQSLKEPYQVSVTFPQHSANTLPASAYQQVNQSFIVYIFGVQKELWAELQLALIDFYADEGYENYNRSKIMLNHPKSPEITKHTFDKYYSFSQSDSDQYDSDFVSDPWGSTTRARKYQKTHPSLTEKTPAKVPVIPKRVNISVSANASNNAKKCAYCGCKSTPMWRRGPAGPGTLCNACGVKWKHGKILQDETTKYENLIVSTREKAGGSKGVPFKKTPVVLIDSRPTRDTTPASLIGEDEGFDDESMSQTNAS